MVVIGAIPMCFHFNILSVGSVKTQLILGWRERNQQDANNLMYIIKTFISTCFWHHYAHHQENKSVHCRIWCSVLVVMAVVVWSWDASCVHCESYCFTVNTVRVPSPYNHSHHNQYRTPYAAVHNLVLLTMGIMMPETCWDKSFDNIDQISCILLISLSSPYVHDARSQEPKIYK